MSNCLNIDSLAPSSSFHPSLAQRTLVISVVTSIFKYTSSSTDSSQTSVLSLSLFLTTDISSSFSAQNSPQDLWHNPIFFSSVFSLTPSSQTPFSSTILAISISSSTVSFLNSFFYSFSFCFCYSGFVCFVFHYFPHSSGHLVIFTSPVFQSISRSWHANHGISNITLYFCPPIMSIFVLSLCPL